VKKVAIIKLKRLYPVDFKQELQQFMDDVVEKYQHKYPRNTILVKFMKDSVGTNVFKEKILEFDRKLEKSERNLKYLIKFKEKNS
jgi:hypothetical protein